MRNKTLLSVTTLVLLAGLFWVGQTVGKQITSPSEEKAVSEEKSLGGAAVTPPRLVQDFTLTDQTGEPVRLSDLRGKVTLMFFGYTHCPDVCPTTLFDYTLVKRELGKDADKVAFVFISVDGGRDTPEVLADYLSRFDSSFIGLRGDMETLERIAPEYGLVAKADTHSHHDSDDNYFVEHTSPSFLIDSKGYLRTVYFYGTEPDVIAAGIRQFMP